MLKEIYITVAGEPGVGKTAIIEFLARCLIEAGIVAVFDPTSLNVVEDRKAGLTNQEMIDRLESIKQEGNRLVVLEEIATNADALVSMLRKGSDEIANGGQVSEEEILAYLKKKIEAKKK